MTSLLSTDQLFGTAQPAPNAAAPLSEDDMLSLSRQGATPPPEGFYASPGRAPALHINIGGPQSATTSGTPLPLEAVTQAGSTAPGTSGAPLSSEELFGNAPPAAPAPALVDPDDISATTPYRLTQAGLRGMTAGLSDKMQAAAHAGGRSIMDSMLSLVPDALRPSPEQQQAMRATPLFEGATPPGNTPQPQQGFGPVYQADLAKERAQTDAFAAQHPIAAGAAYTGGMLTSAPLLAGKAVGAAGTLAKLLQGAKIGGGIGAVSGFSGTNDTSLGEDVGRTALGAAGGAVTGAAGSLLADKIIGPAIGYAAQKFFPSLAGGDATARISDAITKDAAGALNPNSPTGYGIPLAEYIASLRAKLQAGGDQPVTLADVGGENLKALLGSATRAPGPAKQFATEFLDTRDEGAGPRLTKIVNDRISNGASAFSTREALDASRSAAATPLYAKALDNKPPFWTPEVDKLMERPSLQSALPWAKKIAAEQGKTITVPTYQNGKLVGQSIAPDWRSWDYIKQGIDAVIEENTNDFGKMNAYARVANQTRVQLLKILDEANPDYAAARAAYSGPSQSMAALKAGQGFLSKEPDEITADLAGLSKGDRDFYLLGAAQTLRNRLANVGESGNEGAVVAGRELIRQRLRPLFPSDAAYNQFIASAKLESLMAKTRYQITGNSLTAKRSAEDAASLHEGGAGQAIAGAGLMLAGEPVAGSYMASRGAMKVLKDLRQMNPTSNLQVATQMLRSSPQERGQALADILARQTRRRLPPLGTIPLATLAGNNPSAALAVPLSMLPGHSQ